MNQASALALSELQELVTSEQVAPGHVMSLLKTLESPDEEVRAWTCDALQRVDRLPFETLAEVARLCGAKPDTVAVWACRIVGNAAGLRGGFQRELIAALRKHDCITVRQEAARALKRCQEDQALRDEAVAALVEASQEADPRLQRIALQALDQAT